MKLSERTTTVIICGILVVFAGLLRVPLLNSSFWLDEAAQALESSRPLTQQLQLKDDFQPPLIHILVFMLLHLSKAEWVLRTGAAVIPGIATVGVMYLIGKKVSGGKAGVVTAVLLATSSLHIYYSQELRPYSLPTLFACLGWLCLLHLDLQNIKDKSYQPLFYWTILSVAGLFSSYLYPFVIVGQIAYLSIRYRKYPQLLIYTSVAAAVMAVSFSLWLPVFFEQLTAGQQLRTQLPGWEHLVSFSQFKSLALVGGKFIFGVLDLSAHPFYLINGGAIVILTLILLWRLQLAKHSSQKQMLTIFLTWVVLPILLPWLISFWIPIIQPKRVLFALPGLYLGVAWLCSSIFHLRTHSIWRSVAGGLIVIFLGINFISTVSYYFFPKYHREDWRGLHQLIAQKYSPEQAIVVQAFPAPFAGWEWYNQKEHYPTYATGVFELSSNPEAMDRLRLKTVADHQYVLVFDYLRDLTDPQRTIEKDLERFGYTEVDRITPETGLGIVHVYARTRQMLGYSQYSAP